MRTFVRGRFRTAAAVAAAAAMLLSACDQNSPGVAADVAGDQITDHQVDDFAKVLCALNANPAAGAATPTPSRQARFQSLQILIGNALAHKIVDPDSVDEQRVSATVAAAAGSRAALPEDLQGTFDQVVKDFAFAQVGLAELGRKSLTDKGKTNVADQAATTEGELLRTQYAKSADISVDPRFGTMVKGVLTQGDGSLSVPVSQEAVAAQGDNASGADLPANLTCS